MKKRTVLIMLSIIVIAAAVYGAAFFILKPFTPKVIIGGHAFVAEFALTQDQKIKGLSGRESLPQDTGMLFVHDSIGKYSFWMPDMNFPLDIIWIADNTVVEIWEDAQPCITRDDCPVYEPQAQANRIFEINAGLSEKYGIQIGDPVEYVTP